MSALAGGRISYLFITVRDLAKVLAFYRDDLGFEVLYHEEGAFAFLALAGQPKPQLALYAGRAPGPVAENHWFFAVDVPDLDAAVAQLRARGVAVPTIENVPNGRAVKLHDPEGNVVELHEGE